MQTSYSKMAPKYHVANAYHEKIYLRADSDKKLMTKLSTGIDVAFKGVSVGGNMSAEYKHILVDRGFAMLNANDAIEVAGNIISVVTESGKFVANCWEVPYDRSVIVTEDATIVQSKYGKLWKDTDDYYHGRRHCPKCQKKHCDH